MPSKILFTTGIRSEYDILQPVIAACAARGLDPGVIVTGAHLSARFGGTVGEIERDGVRIVARIESLLDSDSKGARVRGAGIQLASLVETFERERPDWVVAPMDREEAITVALAGAYLRIPVAHIGGGDIASDGNVDNAVRHAVTKLAHLHLVTTPRSAERVERMGEDAWRVHVVGAPGLDRLVRTPPLEATEIRARLGSAVADGDFALVIQHPILTNADGAGAEMRATLEGVLATGLPLVVIHPNSDAGREPVVREIERARREHPSLVHDFRNLPREVFVTLLRRARVMVGNSSAGIIEAPLFGLPVVNTGPRQRGREAAENVEFVNNDAREIQAAVERAAFDDGYRARVAKCSNPYGDGRAGERIAHILAATPIDERLLNKTNTF
ncbi:MAG TPA: UDP-N-acetylglucosamine 2-epimerase [Candidatus Thermoplasmatota archaeon]|nr:UDP-N-acetylglucosamine 2-epimerase [Candidatus Thermoplasmatota archaeon]